MNFLSPSIHPTSLSLSLFAPPSPYLSQVLFNLLSLVGLARASDEGMRYNGLYESIMLVNDHDIQVPFAECINGHCDDCSHEKPVWLLLACLTYLAV